jgi:hypothetical protein
MKPSLVSILFPGFMYGNYELLDLRNIELLIWKMYAFQALVQVVRISLKFNCEEENEKKEESIGAAFLGKD